MPQKRNINNLYFFRKEQGIYSKCINNDTNKKEIE